MQINLMFFLLFSFFIISCKKHDKKYDSALVIKLYSDSCLIKDDVGIISVSIMNNNSFPISIQRYGSDTLYPTLNGYESYHTFFDTIYKKPGGDFMGIEYLKYLEPIRLQPGQKIEGHFQFYLNFPFFTKERIAYAPAVSISKEGYSNKKHLFVPFLKKDSLNSYQEYYIKYFFSLEKQDGFYHVSMLDMKNDSVFNLFCQKFLPNQ